MSRVTRTDVAKQYNVDVNAVSQVNSMQLFRVSGSRPRLVSYYTTVGIKRAGVWYITNEKYSCTTTRQINRFIRSLSCEYVRLDTDDFVELLTRTY